MQGVRRTVDVRSPLGTVRPWWAVLGAFVGCWMVLGVVRAAEESLPGREVFQRVCAPCHRPDGSGVSGVYPPLTHRLGKYVGVPEGRVYLLRVVLYGLMGRIVVDGTVYDNIMLPLYALSDRDVAAVLNYVLKALNAETLPASFQAFTPEEVARQRKTPRSPSEVYRDRDFLIKKIENNDKKSK